LVFVFVQSLKTTLKHVLRGQCKHIIQLVLFLCKETIFEHTTEESLAFEKATRILIVEGKQITCTGTDLGQNHLHAPEFALIPQTKFSYYFELSIQALLLERATRLLESLAIYISQTQVEEEVR